MNANHKQLIDLQNVQVDSAHQLIRMVAVTDNDLLRYVDQVQANDLPTQYRQAWAATMEWWQKGEAISLDRYATVRIPGTFEDFRSKVLGVPPLPAEKKHIEATAQALQDASRRLRLYELGGELQTRALDTQDVAALENEVRDRAEGNAPLVLALPDPKEDTKVVKAVVQDYHDDPQDIRGMQSSPDFYALDYVMGGVEQGDYMLIAGRPSMGKSTIISQYAAGLAANGHPGILFSLEMDRWSLRRKIACARAGINSKRLKQGKLLPFERKTFDAEMDKLATLPLWLVDRRGLTIDDIAAITRKAQREHGIKWIIIDTLNKVGDVLAARDMYIGMTKVSLGASIIAGSNGNRPREELIAVIGVAQLSRANESRPDKRPTMSDLRDSGALEQDADKIATVHRPYYYSKDSTEEHMLEVDVLKNRDGETGNSSLYWESKWPGVRRLEKKDVNLDAYRGTR